MNSCITAYLVDDTIATLKDVQKVIPGAWREPELKSYILTNGSVVYDIPPGVWCIKILSELLSKNIKGYGEQYE